MDAPRALPKNVRLALLPPADAVAVFQERKLLAPAFSWADVWQEEHARAFTVAKLMRTDLLGTVYQALGRALTEGRTLDQFARELEPRLRREGWWGKQTVKDPASGQEREVETGSPRRLELIYEVNLRQSYAAGRWARAERGRAVNPFLVYRTMRDERVRVSHQAWDGVALPLDHAWWHTHYPPNGWRCRCIAYAADRRTLDRLKAAGVHITEDAPAVKLVEWVNRRTGAIERIPAGIDPGFAYNPGRISRQAEIARLDAERLDALRTAIRTNAPVLPPSTPTPAPPAPAAPAQPAPPVTPPAAPALPQTVPEWQDATRLTDAVTTLQVRFGLGLYRGAVGSAFGKKASAKELLGLANVLGAELTRLTRAGYGGVANGVHVIDRYAGRHAVGRAFLGAGGPGGRRMLAVNPVIAPPTFTYRNAHGQGFTVYAKSRTEDVRAMAFRHELGHTLESARVKARLAALRFTDANGAPISATDWAARHLSEYSSTDRHEFLAEAFARYLAPNYTKGELPPDLEALLEDLAHRRLD